MSQTKAQLIDPVDGTIVNDDINASAAIAGSKIDGSSFASITSSGSIVISQDNAIHFNATSGNDLDAILRENSGNVLLINSRNDAILNIDSNNDGTDAHFAVAHGAATSSSTELFRVQENGNVGIGTTSPTSSLHVSVGSSGTNSSVGFNEFCIEGGNEDIGMCFLSPAANERTHTIAFGDSNNNNAGKIEYNHSTDDLTLTASDNIILTGDAVGIGTTSPRALLDLGSGSGDGTLSQTLSEYQIVFEAPQGTGDFGRNIAFATSNTGISAAINAVDLGAASLTGLSFATGSASAITEKMRIDSSGKVGIGTTSPTTRLTIVQSADNNTGGLSIFDSTENSSFRIYRTGAGADSVVSFQDRGSDVINIKNQLVGIGTTSPATTLHLDASGGAVLRLQRISSNATNKLELSHDGTDGTIESTNATIFRNGGSERMRIDSSGRFLIAKGTEDSTTSQFQIGESSGGYTWDVGDVPQVLITGVNNEMPTNGGSRNIAFRVEDENANVMFQVSNTGGGNNDLGRVGIGTAVPDRMLHLRSNGVSIIRLSDSDTSGENNSTVGMIEFETEDSNNPGVAANIRSEITDTTNGACSLVISTGTPTTLGTRMTIDSSGNLLIGRTSTGNTGNGHSIRGGDSAIFSRNAAGETVQISRNSNDGSFVEFRSGDSGNASILATIAKSGSSVVYNTSSDYRLKENAVAISDGIARLKTLKPYRFNFKADASKIVDGFFAHEVTPSVPEAITGAKDAVDSDNNPVYQQIDHSKLVPLLVAAVQEEISKREALEAKVAALEAA